MQQHLTGNTAAEADHHAGEACLVPDVRRVKHIRAFKVNAIITHCKFLLTPILQHIVHIL